MSRHDKDTDDFIREEIEAAVAAERERCAKIVREFPFEIPEMEDCHGLGKLQARDLAMARAILNP